MSFLQLKPDPDTLVIFDEIDQMVGANSLYIDRAYDYDMTGNVFGVKYFPNVIKNWKSFVCLRGTIEKDVEL